MDLSEDQIAKCTDQLRTKITEIKHLKNIQTNDLYLKRFLYSVDFNVDDAYERMLHYHETMILYPEFYPKITPLEAKDKICSRFGTILPYPYCDKENRPIYLQIVDNIHELDVLDILTIDDIWMETILSKHPERSVKGICMLVDVKGYSWRMLRLIQPTLINKSKRRMESLPVKEFRVHLVNSSTLMNTALNIIWPFIPEDWKKMVFPHFDNYEGLYEHIDKSSIPKEYGGEVEVNFNEIYENLFSRNDEIAENFRLYRNVEKVEEQS